MSPTAEEDYRHLDEAVSFSHPESLKRLLGKGTLDVNYVCGPFGQTLLHKAASADHHMIVEILLQQPGIEVNKLDQDRRTPFFAACTSGSKYVMEIFLKDQRVDVNLPNVRGLTPLAMAAWAGNLEIVKMWMESGREMRFDVENSNPILFAKSDFHTLFPSKKRNERKMKIATLLGEHKKKTLIL